MTPSTDLATQTKRVKADAMAATDAELASWITRTQTELALAERYDFGALLVPQITNVLAVLRGERDHRAQLSMRAPGCPETGAPELSEAHTTADVSLRGIQE